MKQILSVLAFVLLGFSAASANPLPSGETAPAPLAQPTQAQCGWFVIFLCSRDEDDADDAAAKAGGGAVVIDSSNPNFYTFRQGWHCAAFGPADRASALKQLNTVRRRYPTAYVKQSC
jgi:hypothetical protein